MFQYKVYGLSVFSELEMPELIKAEGKPDVEVLFGECPKHLDNPDYVGAAFEAKHGEFLLRVNNIADFYVIDGNRIVIDKEEDVLNYDMQVFLLGSAFGALLLQRDILPMHGSSVIINNKTVLVTGNSGAGKSSFAAACFKKGLKIINDDISPLEINDGAVTVHPGFPFLKIWKDVMEHLDIATEGKRKIRLQLEKFSVPLGEAFLSKSVKPDIIIILKPHNKPEFQVVEKKGIEKFLALKPHIYRKAFLKSLGKEVMAFKNVSVLANVCRVFEINRPQSPFSAMELVKKVEELTDEA